MEQCKCWDEISKLNDDYSYLVELIMINTLNDEPGAYLKVIDGKNNIPLSVTKIHFCPLCGRAL